MVAAPLLDSSSGWAWTHIRRRRAGRGDAMASNVRGSVSSGSLAFSAPSAMTPLFLMVAPRGGPAIPSARRSDEPASVGGPASAAPDGPPSSPPPRRRRLSWDIPWLGGRSTAPWVVLATVLILAVAIGGALYAKQRPDRLGWTTKTVVPRGDNAIDFTFSVYKSPKAVAACDIVAADRDGGV